MIPGNEMASVQLVRVQVFLVLIACVCWKTSTALICEVSQIAVPDRNCLPVIALDGHIRDCVPSNSCPPDRCSTPWATSTCMLVEVCSPPPAPPAVRCVPPHTLVNCRPDQLSCPANTIAVVTNAGNGPVICDPNALPVNCNIVCANGKQCMHTDIVCTTPPCYGQCVRVDTPGPEVCWDHPLACGRNAQESFDANGCRMCTYRPGNFNCARNECPRPFACELRLDPKCCARPGCRTIPFCH